MSLLNCIRSYLCCCCTSSQNNQVSTVFNGRQGRMGEREVVHQVDRPLVSRDSPDPPSNPQQVRTLGQRVPNDSPNPNQGDSPVSPIRNPRRLDLTRARLETITTPRNLRQGEDPNQPIHFGDEPPSISKHESPAGLDDVLAFNAPRRISFDQVHYQDSPMPVLAVYQTNEKILYMNPPSEIFFQKKLGNRQALATLFATDLTTFQAGALYPVTIRVGNEDKNVQMKLTLATYKSYDVWIITIISVDDLKKRVEQLRSPMAPDPQVVSDQERIQFLEKQLINARQISHDLGNELNTIINVFDQVMSRRGEIITPRLEKTVSSAHESLGTVQHLNRRLVAEGNATVEITLANFSADNIRSYLFLAQTTRFNPQTNKAHTFTFEVAEGMPPRMNGPYQSIKTILGNLIGNADKYGQLGAIHVAVTVIANDSEKEGDLLLHFSVSNVGTLSEGDIKTLFAKRKEGERVKLGESGSGIEGTGIGLGTCLEITNSMNSLKARMGKHTMHATSKDNSTEFWFEAPVTLPRSEEKKVDFVERADVQATTEITKVAPQQNISLKDLEILIVDDNKTNMTILQKMVVKMGCDTAKIRTAKNGQEAINAYQTQSADVIFMDYQMPVMGGLDATLAIRKLPGQPLIYGLTGEQGSEEAQHGITAGMDAVLTKPFNREAIQTKLEAAVVKKQSQ